ncbi:hypothetical protein SH580_07415 [Coraliomargarita algicola]|uniref:Uncharacterized protein n=1 Tax=Coraliomargarita algicola TaxID=3092156 RepID=A0ABZ0RRK5_9BACT|nr:hypothetical protein [Coraliomargarita sp. J2-16]WPJ97537.1 hypothetical protein SH580_07415 [Coraliomargarita sp. J2-16]
MKLPKRLIYLIEAILVIFIGWAIFGVLTHSSSLESVTVTLTPGGVEYHDKTVFGVGANDRAADYWLRVHTTEGTRDLGIFANTEIGDGLTFTPQSNIPMEEIVDLQLLDKDKFENDVLEQFPYETEQHVGVNYTLEISSTMKLESGFAWFFKTPVGIALLTGLMLGIVIVVIGNGGFSI